MRIPFVPLLARLIVSRALLWIAAKITRFAIAIAPEIMRRAP